MATSRKAGPPQAAICEALREHLGELFQCIPHDPYVRLRTPFMYPDGDLIDLYYSADNGSAAITDLGETTGWLRLQTASLRRSPKQQRLIEDVCQTHGVEFFKGMLVTRVADNAQLASAVIRLAQSALRVADLWFTFRSRSVESVTDEVAEFLDDRRINYERKQKIFGRSGKVWAVDFHTRTARRSALVQVLTTGSRSAARSVAEHVLAGWYDLSFLTAGGEALQFVSLFDDTADVWGSEDFKLVDQISEVVRWSRPDEFEEVLRAA